MVLLRLILNLTTDVKLFCIFFIVLFFRVFRLIITLFLAGVILIFIGLLVGEIGVCLICRIFLFPFGFLRRLDFVLAAALIWRLFADDSFFVVLNWVNRLQLVMGIVKVIGVLGTILGYVDLQSDLGI